MKKRSPLNTFLILCCLVQAASIFAALPAYSDSTTSVEKSKAATQAGAAAATTEKPLPAATSINIGSATTVDLPNSSAQSVQLDIHQGRFAEESVGRLLLNA